MFYKIRYQDYGFFKVILIDENGDKITTKYNLALNEARRIARWHETQINKYIKYSLL